MNTELLLRHATIEELSVVEKLYRAAVGREGCAWNRFYPGWENLEEDHNTQNLYVLEKDGAVIGAVSVLHENEYNDAAPWKHLGDTVREIARVVIDQAYAGQGLARKMLSMLFARLKEAGTTAVHLSVACQNQAALKTYERLGFAILGKMHMYGGDYYLAEVEL